MAKGKKWTKQQLIATAKNYETLTAFREDHYGKCQAIYTRGLEEIAYAHMSRTIHKRDWSEEELIETAKEYKTRKELSSNNPRCYNAIIYRKLGDKAFAHMTTRREPRKWTDEALKEAVSKCTTTSEFRTTYTGAYSMLVRQGRVKEFLEPLDWSTRPEEALYKEANIKGIYILYNGDEVIYIGKSHKSIQRRLTGTHFKKDNPEYKVADKIELFEINNTADIDIAEVYLITLNKPTLNKDCNRIDSPTIKIANLNEIILNKKTLLLDESDRVTRVL